MKRLFLWSLVALGVLVLCPESYAATSAGTGLPWDQPLDTLRNNGQNFVAPTLIVIGIILVGCTMAFGDHSVGRRSFGLVMGGSVALGVIAFMTALGWAGAIV